MKLREALEKDFGITVLIESGRGQRNEPYRIESCSAAEALRTQLNLLRGLGLGRSELWRLTGIEMVSDETSDIQKLTIEAVEFEPDRVITTERSYYFDIGKVDGHPEAHIRDPAWSDPRTRFTATQQMGWLHFDRAVDNGGDAAEINTTLFYSGSFAKLALYVYGSLDEASEDVTLHRRRAEFAKVRDLVRQVHPNSDTPWPPFELGPFIAEYFLIGEELSVAGVADMGSHFLKLRQTYYDEPKMRGLMTYTLREMCQRALDL